jgi:hypothetical protein
VVGGGGALAMVVAWLSRLDVGDDARFLIGAFWSVAGIVPVMVVASHKTATFDGHTDFISTAVVASGISMFVALLLSIVLMLLMRNRASFW